MSAGSLLLGTIRPWDGLITVRAENAGPTSGAFVYTGYLVGGGLEREEERGNWIGRWRVGHGEFGNIAWEGTFCLRKRLT